MTPKQIPVNKINVEYIHTTAEHAVSFVDDLCAGATNLRDDAYTAMYLRDSREYLKVLVVVLDARGFNQLQALSKVYDYVLRVYSVTDNLRANLEKDRDEMNDKLGTR